MRYTYISITVINCIFLLKSACLLDLDCTAPARERDVQQAMHMAEAWCRRLLDREHEIQ